MRLTRREFLVRTGWVAAGSTVLASCSWLPVLPTFSSADLEAGCLWVQVLPDGRVRFLCPKSEMGQGIATGLAQVVAEELNVPLAAVEVVAPDTSQIPPSSMTVGSHSVVECFEPLSQAAALLRETLRARAAQAAGIEVASVADAEGGFSLPDGAHVSYGALADGSADVIEADASRDLSGLPRYALERTAERREVGRRRAPVAAEAIVTGREVYSRDVAVPGMLHGRVVRAPRLGATLARVGGDTARATAGVVEVAVDGRESRVGVIAENPFALDAAVAALDLEWRGGEQRSMHDLVRELDVERARERDDFEHTLVEDGDLERAAADARHRLVARYDTSLMAHAAMEPRSAVVSVTDDRVDVWSASQDPWYMRAVVARITGHPKERVVFHNHRLGGAFGGRSRCQATEEAAWLAARVRRPVKVQWTREDEFRGNYFQPPFSHRIDAGVTEEGRITHWCHDFTGGPILMSSAMIPAHLHWAADLPKDPGTHQNVEPPYAIADRRIRYSDVRLPVATGPWRGLAAAPNTFAVESAMDELAAHAGLDPIEFRLRNLAPESGRLARVLREVAKLSGWGSPVPEGRGRGIACTSYLGTTCVATVIEVEVDAASGAVRPTHAWCAHDCGLVLNPDQVEAQIEGNVAWGLSMALHERMAFEQGELRSDNFDAYPVLRQGDAPDIEVALIEPPGEPPHGAGEPAIAPVPAALANALFAATGRRARRLPLRQESAGA